MGILGNCQLAEIGQRHQGYLAALAAAGIAPDPALSRPVPLVGLAVRQAVVHLLAEVPDFDAIFAGSAMVLLAKLDGQQVAPVVMATELVVRGSTRPPP